MRFTRNVQYSGGETVSTFCDAAGESLFVAMNPSGSVPVQSDAQSFTLRADTDSRAVFFNRLAEAVSDASARDKLLQALGRLP